MISGRDLIRVPAGRVTLRDARRGAMREVELGAFEMGRVPVLLGDWRGAHSATEVDQTPVHGLTWFAAVEWLNARSRDAGLVPAYDISNRRVDWNLVADGFRLPTEAEWEYACRAGREDAPSPEELGAVAWTSLDGRDGPAPAATKRPNAFGLADLLGNVWEWCWDYADPSRYRDYRVLRGGGWADRPWSVRPSARRASAPDAILEDVGFRIARGPVIARDGVAQGWSASEDRDRANIRGPLPLGWTPFRELLDDGEASADRPPAHTPPASR